MNEKHEDVLDRIERGGVTALLNVLSETLNELDVALDDARSLLKVPGPKSRLESVATVAESKAEDDSETLQGKYITESVSAGSLRIMEKLLIASDKSDLLYEIMNHLSMVGIIWPYYGWDAPVDLTFVRRREKKS